MELYLKEAIQEIKNKVDYYEFYSKYINNIPTNRAKVFVPCVFHQEIKPSLQIDLETGMFRCWGCQTYGDIFSFYMKFFNVSFSEAVEILAEEYNVELKVSDEVKEAYRIKKSLYEINEIICNKFQQFLQNNNEAYNYLTKIRGFSPKIIKDFRLGCGVNKLPEKDSLKRLGLLTSNKEGEFYSKFRSDRITMPRIDERGNILSFTGRFYTDKEGPKYMHTSDTEIYKKSEYIFGLYQAKKYIKHFNSVILVEGNFDLIKCHQKGIVNSVCLDGLSISEAQVNLLKKYTNTFYICVEDIAMLRPNENRITPLDKIYNKIKEFIPYAKVYIIDLRKSDGSKCDPDEYLSTHTREEFNELIKTAKIYNEFLINVKLKDINPKNIEEKSACINSLIPILSNIHNYLDRKQYIELVANKLLISENDIYRKIKFHIEKQDKINSENLIWDDKPVYAQKILLSMCFCNNLNIKKVCAFVKLKAFEYMEPFYKNIFNDLILPYIINQGTDKINFSNFFSNLLYENKNELIEKVLTDIYLKTDNFEDFDENDVEDLINEQIETLTEFSLPDETSELNEFISI